MSNQVFDIVQAMSGQGNCITIPGPYLDLFAGDRQQHLLAAILNQLVFWSGKSSLENGWFYKEHAELASEIRGVSEDQITRLVNKICTKWLPGIVEKAQRQVNGVKKTHYRVDGDALITKIFPPALDSAESRNGKRDIAEQVPQNHGTENAGSQNPNREVAEPILYTDHYSDHHKQIINPSCPVAPQPDDADPAMRVLAHFNQVTGSDYGKGGRNKTVLGYIRGRLSEDYSAEDLILVVDYLTAKWADDPKMDDYLRPSTLFGPENCVEYFDKAQKWQKRGRPACVKGRWQIGGSSDQNFKASFENVDYSVPANSGFRVSGGPQ